MKKYTRILSLMLCAIMVLCLCACGGNTTSGTMVGFEDESTDYTGAQSQGGQGGNGGTTVSNGGTTVESKVTMTGSDPFANIPKRLKGTTVTFAHFGDEGASEYRKVGVAFEKKTGIKVKWASFNEGEYVAQIAKQINGGAAPDIIICQSTFPAFLEIAQPLQNIVDLNDDFWDDNIVKLGTVGNNSYIVNSLEGVWNSVNMVFYNKKIFSSGGLKTPSDYYKEGKWSYENLKKCLKDVVGTKNIGGYVDAGILNVGLGNSPIQYDYNKKAFYSNIDKTAEAIQYVAQIYKEGLWSANAWAGTFSSGTIGVFVSSAYGTKYNGRFKDADDNMLGAAPLPTSYKGQTVKTSANVRGYGIAKGSKNPEAAAYFLRYYLDYEYYKGAGADVFKNKNLEKVYFDDVIAQLKKTGVNYDFANLFNIYAGKTYKDMFGTLERSEPAQIPGDVAAQKNIAENVVKKANEKLAQYK